jgi:hypothetical protein
MSVSVDLGVLIEAFEDATPELRYFVDRETGEVILVSDTLGFIEAGHQRAAMAESPGRYLAVPVAGLDEFTADLEAFIDQLDDKAARDALDETLDAPNPVQAVDAFMAKHDELTPTWRTHRATNVRARANEWLKENGFSKS